MPLVAITGSDGFVGWHTRVSAHTLDGVDHRPIARSVMNEPQALAEGIDGTDHVIHCAGANRGDDLEVRRVNVELAQRLAVALLSASSPPFSLTFANSTQSQTSSNYGQAKARAGEILAEACAATGTLFRDVQLPGLFGEHGRPGYNSVVATFCAAVANEQLPEVRANKELELLGVRDAATQLLGAVSDIGPMPDTTSIDVGSLYELIADFGRAYRTGEIPPLDSRFRTQLFNTYRSFTFPSHFPIPLARHTDDRGSLVETVRANGGAGQSFVSSTRPGATRGQHFHLDKFERFVVVEGSATISLRRVLFDEVITFEVNGDQPAIVDMPTLWTHNLINVGTTTLITQFWTNQIFDAAAPDTYYEAV